MAVRYYLTGRAGTGADGDHYHPNHFTVTGMGFDWRAIRYGDDGAFIVWADVTPTQHTALAANADLVALPANTTNTVGANLTTVQSALESFNIPADWVTSGMTYRQVLRGVATLFQFAQMFHGRGYGKLIQAGVTLDTQFNALPQGVKNALLDTAQALNYDTSGLTGAITVRQILRLMAQQWGSAPVRFFGNDL